MNAAVMAIAFVFGVLTTQGNVQPAVSGLTANTLVSDCTIGIEIRERTRLNPSVGEIAQMGRCFGYINGFTDANSLVKDSLFCASTAVTSEQTIKVFLKFMTDHPEDLHRPAGEPLFAALKRGFPCTSRK